MKKNLRFIYIFFLTLVFLFSNQVFAYAENSKYYLGGMTAGFSIDTKGAEVVGICDVITNNGILSPAKNAGILAGDVILSIGDTVTDSANDINKAVTKGEESEVLILRNGNRLTVKLTPAKDIDGNYKIGAFIMDSINGIGTITYIKDGKFASLGHPVLSSDGSVTPINGGKLFKCSISGCVKGERGKAGELKGVFTGKNPCGVITENEKTGVYGTLNKDCDFGYSKEIEIGEAEVGDATVFSTVNSDGVKEYSISIIKVDKDNNSNKNYVIKVNDDILIEKTGGIVQGMSGSPIVQKGKLVGAITHVFINDPTRGFAISIQNMIENQQ